MVTRVLSGDLSDLFPFSMDQYAIFVFPFRKAPWTEQTNWDYGKFNMADNTFRQSCQSGKNSYLFDLAGDNVKWKTISLTHVEYPEGDYGSHSWIFSPSSSK